MLGEEKRPLCSTKIHLRVPLERVGVLIGERGEVKRRLEEATGTIITIDSDNGIVIVEPVSPGLGAEGLLRAQEVIKAIAAGFSPERAFRLLEEDQMLVVIDLKEATSGEPHHMTRIKGRIIGEGGKTRRIIEETTGTFVNVGESNVAVIGDYEQVNVAVRAIEMLIEGRPHSTVYAFLNREARRLKRRKMASLWK